MGILHIEAIISDRGSRKEEFISVIQKFRISKLPGFGGGKCDTLVSKEVKRRNIHPSAIRNLTDSIDPLSDVLFYISAKNSLPGEFGRRKLFKTFRIFKISDLGMRNSTYRAPSRQKRRNLRRWDIRHLAESRDALLSISYFTFRSGNPTPGKSEGRNYVRYFKFSKFGNFGFRAVKCDTPFFKGSKRRNLRECVIRTITDSRDPFSRCPIWHV